MRIPAALLAYDARRQCGYDRGQNLHDPGRKLAVGPVEKCGHLCSAKVAANESAIGEWLDAVYADLGDLASVWIRITARMDKTTIEGNVHNGLDILSRGRDGHSKYLYGGRLQSFYHAASLVLQARGEQFDRGFVDDLGSLLMYRNNAGGVLNNEFKSDEAQIRLWLGEMDVALRSIQDQMASLQVLVATFKVPR